ncbi:MAG: (2R)-sulfolactate sulfo-lyase subunit beta, partial [uncultured Microvirga sp.]
GTGHDDHAGPGVHLSGRRARPVDDGGASRRAGLGGFRQRHLHGLAARERARRRAQPRRHPAARRPLERRLRGGRQQRQGHDGAAARLWPAPVRRGSRAAFPHPDRDRLEPERCGGDRDRHRGPVDQPRRRGHRQDRQARDRLRHRGPWRHRDGREGELRGEALRAMGLGAQARRMPDLGAVGFDEVRRERHDDRPRLLPDGRQHVRQAHSARHLWLLRRDLRDHRRRAPGQGTRGDARDRREMVPDLEILPGRRDRGPQDRRPVGFAADQGQHRRRPHDHRGKGARQPGKDRPPEPLHRRPDAGRSPRQGSGPLLHGHVVGGRRMRDPDGGGRLRGPYLPDRAGQRHRQPDRPRDQDHRQPEDGPDHGRAYRCRRDRGAAPRHDHRRGRRRAHRHGGAHGQWPPDRGGIARPSRVLDDQAVSQRV